ncbi:MAG: acyl-CoA synthetase (AMP-forming)/AMP-acid ligase II [Bradymonadia bacterium]|jgi:acyl-CoA synthetase (AMP-forming)/AMP-acid ligase II
MNAALDYQPTGKTLAEAIANAPNIYPNNGFTFIDMAGNDTFWPFSEVEAESAARAKALQDLGLKKGDRVGLIIIEPQDFVLSFLAAARVGIVAVPLYPPMSMGELDSYVDRLTGILTTAQAKMVVASEKLNNVLWQVVDKVPTCSKFVAVESLGATGTPVYPEITEDDICFLQYTSGSTSDPKGVIVPHKALVANVMVTVQHLGLDPHKDVSLAWLPLYHDMGLIGFVMSSVIFGKSCVLIPTLRFLKRPNVWLQAVHDHKATITFCPPFALPLAARRAKDKQLDTWDLSSLHTVGVGAEPIHPEGVRQFTEVFSTRCKMPATAVAPAYGMAEATLAITLKKRGTLIRTGVVNAELFQDEGLAVDAEGETIALEHVSCGIPFPGHEVQIYNNETGSFSDEEGREGEVCTRGPSIAPGYFENPEATADAWRDGWLHTGDLGYMRDGELYVTGRLKDLLIINGRNMHPQSIEWLVQELDGVRKGNVVAFSVPGVSTEEVVVALEKRGDGDSDELASRVRDVVSAEFGIAISEVVVLEPGLLPKTSSGKLQRRKARQYFMRGLLGKTGARTQGSSADAVTLAKHMARSVWARVKNKVSN